MTQNLCQDSRRSLARSSHEKHSLTQVARALPNVVVRTVQTIAKYDISLPLFDQGVHL